MRKHWPLIHAARAVSDETTQLMDRSRRRFLHAAQLRESAESIPANIREAMGRRRGPEREYYFRIARHRGEFPVRLMCRVLDVSVAGFYAYLERPPSWRALIDELLMAHIRIAFAESGETYGAPRVLEELREAGLPTSKKRVARLMRQGGLVARAPKRRRVVTTNSNHGDPLAPNLLARQFDVNGIAVNRVWVGDITYLPTREGPLYLATVLDLGSRRCVGWAMRDTLEARVGGECPPDGARRPATGAGVDLPFRSRQPVRVGRVPHAA